MFTLIITLTVVVVVAAAVDVDVAVIYCVICFTAGEEAWNLNQLLCPLC